MGDVFRLVIALIAIAAGLLVVGPMTAAEPAKSLAAVEIPGAPETHSVPAVRNGEVVGHYFDAAGGHGFVTRKGVVQDVDFPGADATYPVAINGAGAVVGTYLDSRGSHGFWFKRGMFARVEFPGAVSTSPLAINDAGEIVGIYEDQDGQIRGFEWSAEGYVTHGSVE